MHRLSHTIENPIILPSIVRIKEVTISPLGSSSGSPGDDFSLTCSATIVDNHLPSDVPSPTFEWFYGPSGNASLPFGLTPMATVSSNGSTYTSTLQFSPLSQSHAGMYTCRLGAGRLVNSTNVTVNGTSIIFVINFM